jgi:fructuronate reductase
VAGGGGDVMARLSLATLPSVPDKARPPIDPSAVEVGIAHLGIGAFSRAHQATYTQDAMAATGDLRWGICAATQRSARVVDQLAPQDGLYTVLTRSADGARAEVNAAVRAVLSGADRPAAIVDHLAAPPIRVVTLTVTEKGYRHDPATGRLRVDDAGVRADVAAGAVGAPRTVVGQLVRGLQRRMQQDAGPLNVVCCDNLPDNGAVLRRLVHDFIALLPPAERDDLLAWTTANARFPATMVDRIVPATTPDDRAVVTRLLGLDDEGAVVTEPFRQWVIQDDFVGDRPPWERAGATLTADVAPYEAMKLRLLNGTHSALAYLGALAGYEHVADVVRDDNFAGYARALMERDATPTLAVPPGFDLERYQADLLERFGNPALRHRTLQIAMDGSQKLPQRLLGTIRERRYAGAEPRHAILAVAGWMRFVWTRADETGRPLPLDDPLADRLTAAVGDAHRPAEVVDALLGVTEVFGTDLADDGTVRRLLTESLSTLTDGGARAAAAALADSVSS